MNSVWLKLLVFLLPVKGLTAEIRFSEQAKLYLLTTGPGLSIDRSWGHSAIWFIDSLNYIDFVFEYTSTEKNNFVSTLKMLFGKDIYLLRATNLEKYRSEIPEQHQTISYQLISDDKSNIELIYYDLVDDNDESNNGSIPDRPRDRVSGYTTAQMQNALTGVSSLQGLGDNLFNDYNNETEEFLQELIDSYSDNLDPQ